MKIIQYTLASCTVVLSLGLASPAYALLPHWTTHDAGGLDFTDTGTASDDDHKKWIDIAGLGHTSGDEATKPVRAKGHENWIDIVGLGLGLGHTKDNPDDEKGDEKKEDLLGHLDDGKDLLALQTLLHKADERLHRWRKEFKEKKRHHRGHDRDHHRVPQVPVPAAVWLFGSGLLGLVGIARRKKPKTI